MKRLRKRPGVPGVPGVPAKVKALGGSDIAADGRMSPPLKGGLFVGNSGNTPSKGTQQAENVDEKVFPGAWEHPGNTGNTSGTPPEVAHPELLGLQVRHLAELPLPTTVTLDVADVGTVRCTTGRARAAALVEAGELVLTPLEYELLAVSLADGRLTRQEAAQGLATKRERPEHRLSRPRLLGAERDQRGRVVRDPQLDARGRPLLDRRFRPVAGGEVRSTVRRLDDGGERWTWGELLEALGAELVAVEVETTGGAT